MENTHNTTIKFSKNGIGIGYTIKTKQKENGKFVCYIPVFDFIYSANSIPDADKKGDAMVKSFFDYYMSQESFKSLILNIHKMGFRSEKHNFVMHYVFHFPKFPRLLMT